MLSDFYIRQVPRHLLGCCSALALAASPGFAEEPVGSASAAPAAGEGGADHDHQPGLVGSHEPGHASGAAHAPHANDMAIFVGGTGRLNDVGHSAATFGLDYERRLPMVGHLFGVGALFDVALTHHATVIAAPALYVHPIGGLRVTLAPGLEHEGEENVFVMRGGMDYAIHFGSASFGPSVAADYAHQHVVFVAGVDLGYGF
ncbi:MAG: hypothetical protein HY902_10060 [Deltaproteobacteria bacterium]|nr:hypothetical protein [Deltaproteobacteria bacterium]